MGIILSEGIKEYLERSIRKSTQRDAVRKILKSYKKNIADIRIEVSEKDSIAQIDTMLQADKLFAWGIPKDAFANLSYLKRGDILYILDESGKFFKYRAYVTTILRNARELAAEIWRDDYFSGVYFLEDLQEIQIVKEEHLFSFGYSKKSSLSQPIYIKDVYQELYSKTPEEFRKIIYNEQSDIQDEVTQEMYLEAYALVRKSTMCCRLQVGDIALLGTRGEPKVNFKLYCRVLSKKCLKINTRRYGKLVEKYFVSSKGIQLLQNFFHPCSCFRTIYSHAALSIDDGLFIEAKGKDKVIYTTYQELCELSKNKIGTKYGAYFRYRMLTNNERNLISARSLYYVGTPYPEPKAEVRSYFKTVAKNIIPINKVRVHRIADEFYSFCSDLVVQILKPIKNRENKNSILAIEKNSKTILPWDIERFVKVNRDIWTDVTNTYIAAKERDSELERYYSILGKVNKSFYQAKEESLLVVKEFYTITEQGSAIPLWFRMECYHHLKQGTSGKIKEYLARRSLYHLLGQEQ